MKFTAVGDVICQRRLPSDYEGFAPIREFIEQGDARFFNLETTVNYEGECYGCQHSGGTYIRCDPEVAEDMLDYGFNMTSFNNNHAMDFAHEGLVKTLEYVNAMDVVHAGVGMNLHQASAPAYLETANGRVALIAVNTSFEAPLMAGEQSRRIPGRPGINGIRITQKMVLPQKAFDIAKEMGEKTHINDQLNITRMEGYQPWPAEGTGELGSLEFVLGDDYGLQLSYNAQDMQRVKMAIEEAQIQADYVMVSVHAHRAVSMQKDDTPEFLQRLCRELVDYGADAIVGHGPHLLRGIEVYKQKPIFYSLGDFVVQLYNVPIAPEDFYKKYGMNSDSTTTELLKKRSGNFTRGLMEDVQMRETVVPYWETDENKNLTKLVLMPVLASLGDGKHLEGLPQPAKDLGFMDRLAKLSAPFGVTVKMENGLGICTW